ncbi:hypothetical protein GT755_30365 [Herbidospora sp. NEAU-GS84]|uniref:Uncharacterized protein n=1 Tax=Herbidospora solisilvae TaxID=2696284 RepID=A0A7C9N4V2_9ACTN|nr:hypothetical protein [Herbidospora solisilvae]NAS25969.1 hypothetical protein [Herbidospora solisilvae]
MLAVQFDRFGPPDVLEIGVAPDPRPGRGQVRIKVKAAGVSPVDLALPHIPGVDAAGVVDDLIKITGSADGVVTLADFEGPSKGVRLSMGRLGGQAGGRRGSSSGGSSGFPYARSSRPTTPRRPMRWSPAHTRP